MIVFYQHYNFLFVLGKKPPKKNVEKPKPKPIAADKFFGSAPVQQKPQTLIQPSNSSDTPAPKEVPKKGKSRKRKKEEGQELNLEDHFDDDFEATLLSLDEEQLGITPKKTKVSPAKEEKKVDRVVESSHERLKKTPESERGTDHKKTPKAEKVKTAEGSKRTPKSETLTDYKKTPKSEKVTDHKKTPKAEEVPKAASSHEKSHKKTPDKKTQSPEKTKVETPSSKIEVPAESSASKRSHAEAYQRYLQRSGPRNPGSKPIPEVGRSL